MKMQGDIPLKLKNTFIEVDESYVAGLDAEEWFVHTTIKRHMSAPPGTVQGSFDLSLDGTSSYKKELLEVSCNTCINDIIEEPEVEPCKPSDDGTSAASSEAQAVESEWANIVTVMMRNIPSRYTQGMIFDELCETGFNSTFDFLYLPVFADTGENKGYAFINFTDIIYAGMFKSAYEGRKMTRFESRKRISIVPAIHQGFEMNVAQHSIALSKESKSKSRPLVLRQQVADNLGQPRSVNRKGRHARSAIDVAAQRIDLQRNCQMPDWGAVPCIPQEASRDTSRTPAAPTEGQTRQINFCANCGGKVQNTFNFCQYCGKGLEFSRKSS